MYAPDFETFKKIAKPGVIVPIYKEILADLETPLSAYAKLLSSDYGFLLESVEGGERMARYSFLGSDPQAIAIFSRDGSIVLQDEHLIPLDTNDPLDLVSQRLSRPVVGKPRNLPRFLGGAVGYIGYECASLWEKLPLARERAIDVPDAVLMFVDTILIFDRLRHRAIVLSNTLVDEDLSGSYGRAIERIDSFIDRLSLPQRLSQVDAEVPSEDLDIQSNMTPEEFCDAVEKAKHYITQGDIIQVVLSQRWTRQTIATPMDVYRALRAINPSPYMFLLQMGDISLVGASPEMLVRVQDGEVSTHPIAGTRPRGKDEDEDKCLEEELRADPKERAEHIMLVDLGRNDIGRVSIPGTVRVTQLMDVERYSHVMHLVSHVVGRLRDDYPSWEALRACFPAGTVSGAPKIRAMEIIADLEREQRGPYAGALGYFGYGGNLDMAITIRTILMKDGLAHVQAGAGIVADSEPVREYQETRNKARALMRAIGMAESFSKENANAAVNR